MQASQVLTNTRQSKSRAFLVLCLSVAAIVMATSFVVGGRGAFRNGAQGVVRTNLSVQDPRPLAKAIKMLEGKYGWVITYEDPRYVHPSEIADVTNTVRKDLYKYRPGEAPRVLVPKGGALSIQYDVMSDTGFPIDREAVLRQLLDANSANGNAGRFRLEKTGEVLHVIPTASKISEETFAEQESVLDAVITLPEQERSSAQTLEAICAAVSDATHTHVGVGTIPLNRFLQHRDQKGTYGETARDVLLKLLERTGTNLTWRLLYDPGLKVYALNIHEVRPPSR
jgi:hypothetical protein